jgi:hypothetical protein
MESIGLVACNAKLDEQTLRDQFFDKIYEVDSIG